MEEILRHLPVHPIQSWSALQISFFSENPQYSQNYIVLEEMALNIY